MNMNDFIKTEEPLFNAIFVPNLRENIKKGRCRDNAEITNIAGRKNHVAVGKPYCRKLTDVFEAENQTIPITLKEFCDKYDFYLVVLSCSFLPDPDCKFIWARFGVDLNAYIDGKRLKENPIAYDMYPDEVLNEVTVKSNLTFSADLKLCFSVINNEEKIEHTNSKEYIRYEPEITAFGYQTSSVAWNFKSTSSKDISGNKRNLVIVVQTPKNSSIKGKFLVGAEIKTNNIFIPLKRIDDLIDIEYPLS